MFSIKRRRDRENRFLTNPHDPALAEILRLAFDEKHSPRADEKDRPENVEDELEAIDQLDSDEDHDSTHDQRADDSPDQRAMLRHARDLEILKDDNENENVVDAERVLDHVTGEEFEPFLRSVNFPNEEVEQE